MSRWFPPAVAWSPQRIGDDFIVLSGSGEWREQSFTLRGS